MAFFKKKNSGVSAAHVKDSTVGTSNEVSFSVLDKARMEANGEDSSIGGTSAGKRLGRISLFTLPSMKKPAATPTREDSLPLESGGFVAASGESSAEAQKLAAVAALGGDASRTTGNREMPAAALPTVTSATTATSSLSSGSANALALTSTPKSTRDSWGLEEEVSRRKKKRRRRRVAGIAVGAVVCIALVCVGAFFVNRAVQEHNQHVVGVKGALQTITKADETLLELDALISNPLSEDSLEDIQDIQARLPETRTQLEAAKKAASEESADMNSSKDKEAAANAVDAATARLQMLDAAEGILPQASAALQASTTLQQAWEGLIEADSALKLSANMVSAVSDETGFAESRDKAYEARLLLQNSVALVAQAQNIMPQMDTSALTSYANKRIECAEYAAASCDALIDEDTELAQEKNTAYNTADAQAVEMARALPSEPAQPAFDAYEEATAEDISSYTLARSQAGITDQALRAYLNDSSIFGLRQLLASMG